MTSQPNEAVDLTGEAPVLGAGTMADGSRVLGLIPLPYRVPCLVVCRESNEYDSILLQGLVEQTLAYVADRPSAGAARQLGIRPLVDGAGCGLAVAPLAYGSAKAVLFEIRGDYFLYAMTSAARSNADGDNDWTVLLSQTVLALRPEILQVATLSRLVRSFQHSSMLLHAVSRATDEVRAGHTVMRMRGEGQETGQLMWAMLAMVAASERNLIVQRLTAGVVAKYRRGEWVRGKAVVPLGYRLDESTKKLELDRSQEQQLRMAWTWMADPHLAGWEIVRRLGALGVKTPMTERVYGPEATIGDHTAPDAYITQLLRWEHLYRTGYHVTKRENPFEGARHIAGMPVVRTGEREELHFAYQLESPALDPALIDAAVSARSSRAQGGSERGGASRDRIPPLNQTAWIQDGFEYWLASGTRNTYELRVRRIQEKP